jgi:Spy/CpxP family protein refolding chaperone
MVTPTGVQYNLQERRMRVIRIAVLAVALCAASTSIAAAQGQPQGQGGMRGGEGRGGWLLKDITLTEAQKTQIKTIRDKYVPQMMDLRKSAEAVGGPDETTRSKMMDLQTKQSGEIRAVLTADQQATFDKNVAEMKARMDARRNGSS